MLKIDITDERTFIGIKGDTNEICCDFVSALHYVYEQMREEDKDGAEGFKDLFMKTAKLAFMDEDEIDRESKKLNKEHEEKKKEACEEVSNTLKEALEILENGGSLKDISEFFEGLIRK